MAENGFTIRINRADIPAFPDETILAACSRAGIEIPALCHYREQEEPCSFCMVCAVIEEGSGAMLPSCSSLCRPGMSVLTDTDEVLRLRKGALELLLREHVGDCYAPCTLLCPDRLPVPQILHYLKQGKRGAAVSLLLKTAPFHCADCPAPCMKGCRRKGLDRSVDIKGELTAAVRSLRPGDLLPPVPVPAPVDRSFISVRRKGDRDIFDDGQKESESSEAHRCLECDCLKSDSCLLKKISSRYGASRNSYRGDRPDLPARVRRGSRYIHEPGKCIRCGICVSITRGGPGEFVFFGKGSSMFIRLLPGGDFPWAVAKAAPFCPVGALAVRQG
jgi:hypothetical protein